MSDAKKTNTERGIISIVFTLIITWKSENMVYHALRKTDEVSNPNLTMRSMQSISMERMTATQVAYLQIGCKEYLVI